MKSALEFSFYQCLNVLNNIRYRNENAKQTPENHLRNFDSNICFNLPIAITGNLETTLENKQELQNYPEIHHDLRYFYLRIAERSDQP
ncbi:unnamed protein product [Acanthoscelides obtectus]|uniref:Uncharacterized protein n=1 Tax=Acanthoscelides obtectus TaxID=200917 RepID=A0A9P0KIW9_ACAOB|nr:unnamed protein product [Acanthoscelides obtectus]CAK1685455.1 hypothetical protein AOBTE_LOCUS35420 [Acanthoscelides obtectus]